MYYAHHVGLCAEMEVAHGCFGVGGATTTKVKNNLQYIYLCYCIFQLPDRRQLFRVFHHTSWCEGIQYWLIILLSLFYIYLFSDIVYISYLDPVL